MAKDPATLWYWNDWNGGTMTLSRHLKGCYMDLLSAQFNSGPLSLEEIKTILGSDFGQSWPAIQKKFKQADGLFFNERMEAEKEKRKQHSKKQSENVKKRWEKYDGNTIVYTKPIPLENENEDENENLLKKENEKFLVPQILQTGYQRFPTYTKSKTDDYHAVLRIINFMIEQHDLKGFQDDASKEKIKGTFEAIAEQITKDPFWINKPIKSIANNIQEFYNKIKNPQHANVKQPTSRQAASKQSIDYLLNSIGNDMERIRKEDSRA